MAKQKTVWYDWIQAWRFSSLLIIVGVVEKINCHGYHHCKKKWKFKISLPRWPQTKMGSSSQKYYIIKYKIELRMIGRIKKLYDEVKLYGTSCRVETSIKR